MRKLQFVVLSLCISFSTVTVAQEAEMNPFTSGSSTPESTNDLFDFLFNIDLQAEIGANGNAGVAYVNGEFWVSAWASNLIHILDSDGGFLETITVSGVSGIRSMTYDGTFLYMGNASNQIFVVDPQTRDLEETIICSPTGGATTRMVAYDPELNDGEGGFYISDFNSDIAILDMDGNQIGSISNSVHTGDGVYGGAVDHVSQGGPYLWIHEQKAGVESHVRQLQLPDGSPTGVMYDYNASGQQPAGNTSIAGGLFIAEYGDDIALIGIGQGTPADQLFGVVLHDGVVGIDDQKMSSVSIYPNPARGFVNVETGIQGEKQVTLYDVLGKQVMQTTISENTLDISGLQSGVYMVSIQQKGVKMTRKLIVE